MRLVPLLVCLALATPAAADGAGVGAQGRAYPLRNCPSEAASVNATAATATMEGPAGVS